MAGKKPPLGAKPYYILVEDRIFDLATAIRKNSNEMQNTRLIKTWAREIVAQCELYEYIKMYEEVETNENS